MFLLLLPHHWPSWPTSQWHLQSPTSFHLLFYDAGLWYVSYGSLSYPVILRIGGGRGKGKGHGFFPIGQVKNFVRIFFYAFLQNTLEENSYFLNNSSSLTAACSVFSLQPILYLTYHVLVTLAFFASWPFCAPSHLWAFATSSPWNTPPKTFITVGFFLSLAGEASHTLLPPPFYFKISCLIFFPIHTFSLPENPSTVYSLFMCCLFPLEVKLQENRESCHLGGTVLFSVPRKATNI